MSHPSNGIIYLYNSGDESVGSDVEEVVQWDKGLSTFMTAVTILSGRKYNSPNQESQHKVLLMFIGQPAHNYLQSREDVNAANARLREDAEANNGDGKFQGAVTKVGCYCYHRRVQQH
jgi:hypothetical protein